MQAESGAKAYVLTHGVRFSEAALGYAEQVGAKRQNAVYNLPVSETGYASGAAGADRALARPQELLVRGRDGYTTCVSAVAPVYGREPAVVDYRGGRLLLSTPAAARFGELIEDVVFVVEPSYYARRTSAGTPVTHWVSACGCDELNVWPWHDCAISQPCGFCGVNSVQAVTQGDAGKANASRLRRQVNAEGAWSSVREQVIGEIAEAVDLAVVDECYQSEVHLIIISGNLADRQLDAQARIYADIARAVTARHASRFAEGAVAVTAPPLDLSLLRVMRDSGIGVGVFNLEAFTPSAFATYCPGKNRIGRGHYLSTLVEAVDVFGRGRSWCNFVLGLESPADLLSGCEELASRGVTPGANVFHRDHGAANPVAVPEIDVTVAFYQGLATIYREYGLRPYYCQRALRTSLANEAFDGRLE